MFKNLLRGALVFAFLAPSIALADGGTKVRFVAHTASEAIAIGDTGPNVWHTNTGAAGDIVLALPQCKGLFTSGNPGFDFQAPSTIGAVINVVVTSTHDIDLNPFSTVDSITPTANSGGDAISSAATKGNAISLLCTADATWTPTYLSGTWTDVN